MASTAADLSLAPETGVLEAVARAVDHVSERRTAVPQAEIRAVAVELQKATAALGTLARKKAPAGCPWNLVAQVLVDMSDEAEAVARKRR